MPASHPLSSLSTNLDLTLTNAASALATTLSPPRAIILTNILFYLIYYILIYILFYLIYFILTFTLLELLARLWANVEHSPPPPPPPAPERPVRVRRLSNYPPGMEADRALRRLARNGKYVTLTPTPKAKGVLRILSSWQGKGGGCDGVVGANEGVQDSRVHGRVADGDGDVEMVDVDWD